MRLLFHAHTTYSRDGHLEPAELARLAAERGFERVFLSDHFEDLDERSFRRLVDECDGLQSTCRLVPGYERDWGGYHVIAFGVSEWIDSPEPTEWARQVREAGGLVCLAHSARYRQPVPKEVCSWCDAIEVWNSKWPYDGLLGPHPEAYELLGESRFPLAGQDIHKQRDFCDLAVALAEPGSDEHPWQALREGSYTLSSRILSLEEKPGPVLAVALRLWHPIRRAAWRTAARLHKILRKRRNVAASR